MERLSQPGTRRDILRFPRALRMAEPRLHLSWSVEGGLQRQRGLGLDQDLFTARTHLDWNIGKLNAHLGYDYQNQDFNGETRMRNFAYLRFRRNF